jgi:DNA polymerase-3 subunit beta
MKFSCTQENLQHALSTISHVAAKSTHLPILHNVLITATEAGVELVATDLEIVMRVKMRAKVESPGEYTVPAQVFASYVGLLKSERVDLELQGDELLVAAGENKTKVKGQAPDDFPPLPQVGEGASITLPASELAAAVKQTLVAVSHDHSRPELTSVLLKVTQGQLLLVATDTYRLAEKAITLGDAASDLSVLIPGQTLQELGRVLPQSDEEVTIQVDESQVRFSLPLLEMTSRLIEGEFPDYKQVIPTERRTLVTLDKNDCIAAIKASSLFTRSGIFDINIHVSAEDGMITLTSVNNQVGENVTKVKAAVEGDSNNIVFNYKYVLDALAQIPTQSVAIRLIDNELPAVMVAANGEDDTYLHLIMPIKP